MESMKWIFDMVRFCSLFFSSSLDLIYAIPYTLIWTIDQRPGMLLLTAPVLREQSSYSKIPLSSLFFPRASSVSLIAKSL